MPLQPQCLIPVFHIPRPLLRYPQTIQFHSTSAAHLAQIANHYETLGLDHTASAGAIKKQFYNLSKTHHPDLNPNDPTAHTRFVAIWATRPNAPVTMPNAPQLMLRPIRPGREGLILALLHPSVQGQLVD